MSIIIKLLLGIAIFSSMSKENFLLFIIALEFIILATNLNFTKIGISMSDTKELFNALISLAIATVDTAIGLFIWIRYFMYIQKKLLP